MRNHKDLMKIKEEPKHNGSMSNVGVELIK